MDVTRKFRALSGLTLKRLLDVPVERNEKEAKLSMGCVNLPLAFGHESTIREEKSGSTKKIQQAETNKSSV
jgi:hypothetical protein